MNEPLFTIDRDGENLIIALPETVLSVVAEDIQEEAQTILEHVNDPTVTNLVMDFGQCPYVGSALLNTILAFYKAVRDKQGHFSACNLSKGTREILLISKLDTLWPVFDSRVEALESVKR